MLLQVPIFWDTFGGRPEVTVAQKITSELLGALAQETHVFARVTPSHKLEIVRALQGRELVRIAVDGEPRRDRARKLLRAGGVDPDRGVVDAFLAIPEYRPGGHNVSTTQADRDTRYQAEVLMRRDENTGLAEKPIQVARKNFRILLEGESLEGSLTLPLARVTRTPAGELELDPRFVPPVLDIGANDYLMAIARRLVELLSAKSTELSGTRRQRGQSLADFGIADIANFWLLYTANTYLPVIRHLFEVRRGHPAELFEAMLALAGALTTFSTQVDARSMPSYDHADLTDSFTGLD